MNKDILQIIDKRVNEFTSLKNEIERLEQLQCLAYEITNLKITIRNGPDYIICSKDDVEKRDYIYIKFIINIEHEFKFKLFKQCIDYDADCVLDFIKDIISELFIDNIQSLKKLCFNVYGIDGKHGYYPSWYFKIGYYNIKNYIEHIEVISNTTDLVFEDEYILFKIKNHKTAK